MRDISALIDDDHDDLDRLACALVEAAPRSARWTDTLSRARLLHAAHTQAEAAAFDEFLDTMQVGRRLHGLIDGVAISHRSQERLLDELSDEHDAGDTEQTAAMLRAAMFAHSRHQRIAMWPELLRCAADRFAYSRLAHAYASQRRISLSMLAAPLCNASRDPARDLEGFDHARAMTLLAHRSAYGLAAEACVRRNFVLFTDATGRRRQ